MYFERCRPVKLFSIEWLLSFLTHSIVEGDVASTNVTDSAASAADESTPEPQTLAETVLEALDAEDEADDVVATDETQVDDHVTDEVKTDEVVAATEDKPKSEITDDDLKPLDSKNANTNERFTKITEGYKQEKQRAQELESEVTKYKSSFESLKQLGFNDEAAASDLVEFSAFRHVLATGDADKFQSIIGEQIKQFELLHGKKVSFAKSGVLDDFPDLQEKVNNLELDEDTALRVARAERLTQRAEREKQNNVQRQQTDQKSQQALQSAVDEVDELQNTWRTTDADFPVIVKHLQPKMEKIAKSFPPNQWATAIKLQYETIKESLAKSVQTSTGQPLRGNGNLTGKPAPTNMTEAVLQEMGMA